MDQLPFLNRYLFIFRPTTLASHCGALRGKVTLLPSKETGDVGVLSAFFLAFSLAELQRQIETTQVLQVVTGSGGGGTFRIVNFIRN